MLKIVNFFLRSSWKIILFASVTSSICAGLNLLVFRYLTLLVTKPEDDYLTQLGIISAMVVSSVVISFYSSRFITKYYDLRVTDYRKALAEKILGGDFQQSERKLDRLVAVMLFEISTVGSFGNTISGVIVAAFQVIVVMVYLLTISWELSVMIIVIYLVSNIVNTLTLTSIRALEKQISESRFKLHFSLDRLEKGLKDLSVNSHHGKVYVENSVNLPSHETAAFGLKLFTIKAKADGIVKIIQTIGIGAVLAISLHMIGMEQSMMIEYLALVLFINSPANTIFGFFKSVQNVQNALDQVEAFDSDLMSKGKTVWDTSVADQVASDAFISIRNVTFTYQDKKAFTLGPVSFEINKNEIVIINGSNGSGKSTLFKLITGLYHPDQGGVYHNGQLLTSENIQAFRDLFGCYFTDTPVFDDLTYLDSEMVKRHGNEFIDRLQLNGKLQFDTVGHINIPGLSHGQRGRLNLLRLLLQDNEIYFFDEWAANQDIHFKRYFYQEIVPSLKKQGKTVIIISHDDKFYSVADRIISLKNGQLITDYN